MSYCTLTDIQSVIPERQLINLTVDVPDVDSVVDENVFSECAEVSDSTINGYIRARYTLPLAVIPQFLKSIAVDITAYRLYMRRPQDIPEHIKENHKIALSQLSAIQKGNVLLEDPSELPEGAMPPKKSSFVTNKRREDRVFSNLMMRKMRDDYGC